MKNKRDYFEKLASRYDDMEGMKEFAYSLYLEKLELEEDLRDLEHELDLEVARSNSFLGY